MTAPTGDVRGTRDRLRIAWPARQPDPEISRKARTTAGSNWLPACLISSSRAAASEMGFLYTREVVITW
jgi:hypothetical protein